MTEQELKLSEEEQAELKGVLRFWESKLVYDKWLLDVSTTSLIELTIKYLKKELGL